MMKYFFLRTLLNIAKKGLAVKRKKEGKIALKNSLSDIILNSFRLLQCSKLTVVHSSETSKISQKTSRILS